MLSVAGLAMRASTARRLGFANVGRTVVHRFRSKAGVYKRHAPVHPFAEAAHLVPGRRTAFVIPDKRKASLVREADALLKGQVRLFFRHDMAIDGRPNWHANPFTGATARTPAGHWTDVADFDPTVGDIKAVWELSRFDWLITLARAYATTLDERYIQHANLWLGDWQAKNPANAGPNWRCAQETALRALAAVTALRIVRADTANDNIWDEFFLTHAHRIAATTGYAIAQQNNHAISEAVGLYVIGMWLAQQGATPANRGQGRRFARDGRRMLEKASARLFMPDGSFSQHSVTYHRLALDLLNHAEWWRRRFQDEPFLPGFMERYEAASGWLKAFVDEATGDAPNLGPNDGAWPLRLCQADYRDFRPSVNMAWYLLHNRPAFDDDSANELAAMLDLEPREARPPLARPPLVVFPDGGYAVLTSPSGTVRAYLRFPRFRFRPTHADPLHVDIWYAGQNIARDGGSFSYAHESHEYYRGIESHNTVQFDGRQPMPVMSRFLHGHWLRDAVVEEAGPGAKIRLSYEDSYGAKHVREVIMTDRRIEVEDRLSGFADEATLRWRLHPGNWQLEGTTATDGSSKIVLSGLFVAINIVEGKESRYYLEEQAIPVIEARLAANDPPAVVRTAFIFNDQVRRTKH